MALPAAEGEISLAEDYLASTIAASARFQSLVGAANATAAKERIYFDLLPPPVHGEKHSRPELVALRPCCIVYTDENAGLTFVHDASGVDFSFNFTGGQINFELIANVPDQYSHDPSAVARWFKNHVGVIVKEMGGYAGKAGYLAIERLEVGNIGRAPVNKVPTYGDYVGVVGTVQWGHQ